MIYTETVIFNLRWCIIGRWTIEAIGTLEPRRSALEDDFEEEEEKDEDEQLLNGLDADEHEKVCHLNYSKMFLSTIMWYPLSHPAWFLVSSNRSTIVVLVQLGKEIVIEEGKVTDTGTLLITSILFYICVNVYVHKDCG